MHSKFGLLLTLGFAAGQVLGLDSARAAGASPLPSLGPVPTPAVGVDPLASTDWALGEINLFYARHQTVGSPIRVAILDTGIDYTHEDLRGALLADPTTGALIGLDALHPERLPFDRFHFDWAGCVLDPLCMSGQNNLNYLTNAGQGTHAAGRIAGLADNRIGSRGIAAGAHLIPIKVIADFDETDPGHFDLPALERGVAYAIQNQARVLHFGFTLSKMLQMDEAGFERVKKVFDRTCREGLLVSIPSGNEGIEFGPSYGAQAQRILELSQFANVVVTTAIGQDGLIAPFANSSARWVQLAAPGVRVLSSRVGGGYSDFIVHDVALGRIDWTGTQIAASLTTGAATLLWSHHPDWSAEQVIARLRTTARRSPQIQAKIESGILDVAAALN